MAVLLRDANGGAVGESAGLDDDQIARLDAFEDFDLVADAPSGADALFDAPCRP